MTKKTQKRLRIFAGPNGSGKSTLSDVLKNHSNERIKLGIFVNADEIEKEIDESGSLSLKKYNVKSTTKAIQDFVKEVGMSPIKMQLPEVYKYLSIKSGKLSYSGKLNSYIAADIASFIRIELLKTGTNFSFETVFSHESKLDFMKLAKQYGYRVYFYFITTDDPDINVNRVNIRVAKNGHPVPEDKIRTRYVKSLQLLYDAIKMSSRAYLFDNSGKYYELVAEITGGKKVTIRDVDGNLPNWFIKYVYKKS